MGSYLVTGATAGIGAAVAERLRDHDLILAGRDPAKVDAACAALPSARPLVVDLNRFSAIGPAVAELGLDRLDGVVHSAGVVNLGPVAEIDVANWTGTFAVNVIAPAELTRALLPALRRARGHVLFVNSGQGLAVRAEWTSYAASKFALRALADGLRAEEAPHGVRVSTVYPGRTGTEMQRRVHEYEKQRYDPTDHTSAATVAAIIVGVLTAPPDATLADVTIRPGVR